MRKCTDQETWLPVVGYEGFYEVSNQGEVRSVSRIVRTRGSGTAVRMGKILSPGINRGGHSYVILYRDGVGRNVRIHRVVLEAFVGQSPDGYEGCHKNDIKGDNRLSNLRWGTPTENMLDRVRNGIHHKSRQDRCPLGHLFVAPNLAPAQTARGWRGCLACGRARSSAQCAEAHGRLFDFKAAADRNYELIMSGRAPAQVPTRDRTECPLEHRLAAPNLRASRAARGHRECLACARAHGNKQHAKLRGLPFDFRAAADEHYRRIMENPPRA